MLEIWKDVKGFEGRYEVSDLGRVRSVTHIDNMYWFSNGSKRTMKGRVLKSTKKDGKYHVVALFVNKHNQKYVHRLVAAAFISDIPKGMCINHIDGDIDNNAASNLEIVNYRSNAIHTHQGRKQSSKYVGVYWNKARKKYVAMARAPKGEKKYLGGFDCEVAAHKAYMDYVTSHTEISFTPR